MSDDLIQKLRNSPPREICEHGSQRVKCDHCDNERLEIENERLRELADAWCDQHQRDSAELRNLCAARDEARVERDALRARIDGAAKVEVKEVGDDEFGQPRVLAYSTRDELRKGAPLVFKRVALVPLDD